MKRRAVTYILALLMIVITVTVYLVLTGENGLSRPKPPGRSIEVTRLDPAEIRNLGWKTDGLDEVFSHVATLSTDSLMIVTDGQVVGAFGDLSRPYNVHSIRKSLLSTLIGRQMASDANQLRLDATLQELGIGDAPVPLTELQRQTTVRHLLKSVSGINHPAAASGSLQAEIDRRLGHNENQPGTRWAYNNWDYNTLTTVFESETGTGIAEAFDFGIAQPIGMEDFERSAVAYISDASRSEHRAAMFTLSARDLARIGELYLNHGRAGGQHVLAENWARLITQDFTETGIGGVRWGHGYLWWIPGPETGLPEGTFCAWGLGNQALMVIPRWNTVVVHQSDTTEFWKRFVPLVRDEGMTGEAAIEQLILSCREAAAREIEYCSEHRFITRREFDKLISLIVAART
ncbi:serine hydrolase domain-containing protein [Roseibium marinum]|uniref:CubicO group peptidase (Beta-lactamase class C family) n=1 Tax=Roseibium marinum TaxID=281252 RepID=A0A2S3UKD4_9HYPH|nr:serine hydrolase [Roseibium marinum]POF28188.1 CubicO group peptidase (beta-lactamase class C family) [Roseibium marinum]